MQARVHLAANELKNFHKDINIFFHNIVEINVKIMHERIRLNFVLLNKMFNIFQNDP